MGLKLENFILNLSTYTIKVPHTSLCDVVVPDTEIEGMTEKEIQEYIKQRWLLENLGAFVQGISFVKKEDKYEN